MLEASVDIQVTTAVTLAGLLQLVTQNLLLTPDLPQFLLELAELLQQFVHQFAIRLTLCGGRTDQSGRQNRRRESRNSLHVFTLD